MKESNDLEKLRMMSIVQDVATPNVVEMQFVDWIFVIGIYVDLINEKVDELMKLEGCGKLKFVSE